MQRKKREMIVILKYSRTEKEEEILLNDIEQQKTITIEQDITTTKILQTII